MQDDADCRVIVVTGAGSGIGRAICLELDEPQNRLVLVGRREEPLQKLAGELKEAAAFIRPTDVSSRTAVAALHKAVGERYGRLDVLYNCAGIFSAGGGGGIDEEAYASMMETNFFGTLYCTRAAIPLMRQGGGGQIVNISSLGGKYPFPGSAAYSASKYAVAGLSNALRRELKQEGIYITTVFPSFVGSTMLEGHLESVRKSYFFRLTGRYSPEQAAKAIIGAAKKKKRELVIPPITRFTVPCHALCPELTEKIVGLLCGGWPHYDQIQEP